MTVRRSGIHRQSTQWPENPVIRLHSTDDVVIARRQLVEGMWIADQVIVRGLIPPGHKVAARLINQGEPVKRYGQIIGFATQTISQSEHVHTQNLAMGSFKREYAFAADAKFVPAADKQAGFMGITRPDGRVATRNYILPVAAAGFAVESFGDILSSRWEESSIRKHVRIAVQSPIESGRCFSINQSC
jgi:altronate dehydratase